MTRVAIALIILLALPMLVWSQRMAASTTIIAGVLDSQIATLHIERHSAVSAPASMQPAFTVPFHAAPVFTALEETHVPAASAFSESSTISEKRSGLAVFSGARFRDVIQLRWKAISSADVLGFEVERRSQRCDTWEVLGYVRSDAGADLLETFSFIDHMRDDGVAYYRLRQIRSEDRGIVSPVISVSSDDILASFSLWKHSLQPFQNYGTVSFGLRHSSEVKLTLHDRFGYTIATLLDYTTMDAGHHVFPFSTEMLRPGLNFLRLHTAAGTQHLMVKHI